MDGKSMVILVIAVVIVLVLYFIRRLLSKLIGQLVDNLFNKAEAGIRNRKHQKQGTQSLSDRYKSDDQQ